MGIFVFRMDCIQTKKARRYFYHRAFRKAAAAYSPTWCSSTIGASELNFSVRDGKRWTLTAITAAVFYLREIHSDYQSWLQKRFRAISTGRLKTLLLLHLLPINVVVSHDPQRSLILKTASRLDAFSAYPDRTWIPGGAAGATTGIPEVRPTRSSRTKVRPSQTSNAHNR